MKSTPGNMAASVRDRLKVLARTRGENFDLMLVRYALNVCFIVCRARHGRKITS